MTDDEIEDAICEAKTKKDAAICAANIAYRAEIKAIRETCPHRRVAFVCAYENHSGGKRCLICGKEWSHD